MRHARGRTALPPAARAISVAQLSGTNGAAAPALRVDRARQDLFAGAGLALQQDRNVGRRDARRAVTDVTRGIGE